MTVLHNLFVDEYASAGPASLSLLADEYMNMNRQVQPLCWLKNMQRKIVTAAVGTLRPVVRCHVTNYHAVILFIGADLSFFFLGPSVL